MRFRFHPSIHQDPDLRDALVQAATGFDRTRWDQLYAVASDYYAGVLFTGYAADGIRRRARRLRQRRLRLTLVEPVILDAPINPRDPGMTWRDRVAVPPDPTMPAEPHLCDIPADPTVAWAVSQLTTRQQQVVFMVVCGQSTEMEAGAVLGTSQQNINKVKLRALRRLQALVQGRGSYVA